MTEREHACTLSCPWPCQDTARGPLTYTAAAQVQPAPEADERGQSDADALALILAQNIGVTDRVARAHGAILAAGFHRSQPAPRTVTAEWMRQSDEAHEIRDGVIRAVEPTP